MSMLPFQMKPTHPSEVMSGLNKIVVPTVHYGFQSMIMEKDVPIKMRDGITLYVNVFRPEKPGKYPVVMSADIYGKDLVRAYDERRPLWPTIGVVQTSLFAPPESPDPGFWVPNGYVVVKVALRGSSNSEGSICPLSEMESLDYYEVIGWAGVQEWSNGNVGTNGVSYLAMTQWPVAALNPPHLKAMIPWEGVSDLYREWAFHGGIPDTGFFRMWAEKQKTTWPKSEVEPLIIMQRQHPLFDEYWNTKQAKLSQIKVPMFVGASWSTQGLHNRGTLEGFKQSSSRDKWLEVHGRKEWEYYYSREVLERQKRFFDYFLKEIENDWMDMPRVRLEVRERFFYGMTRLENEWPIARTKYTIFFLKNTNMALSTSPSKDVSKVSYSAEGDKGVRQSLMYKITFNEDTELTGYMKLKLWVSAKGSDDMDLFVGIKKFDRRGNEILFPDFNHIENGHVAYGWLRVSHRELDPEKSTPDQPWLKHTKELKLKSGEIVPVEIEILPSSTIFRSGESLGVVIQGSDLIKKGASIITKDFGERRYQHMETVNKGEHFIYCGGKYDSHLLVPIIV